MREITIKAAEKAVGKLSVLAAVRKWRDEAREAHTPLDTILSEIPA